MFQIESKAKVEECSGDRIVLWKTLYFVFKHHVFISIYYSYTYILKAHLETFLYLNVKIKIGKQ
jgi:hypothetical protein